jgi:MFS family permease
VINSAITAARREDPRAVAAPAWPDAKAARYSVDVLMVSYTFAYTDRSILGLLFEYIRTDLGISDTQVSLLGGAAFAVFYVIMGLPMGWLADHVNRRNLIVGGMLIWSCMTAAGGFAHSFGQLFFTRIWVGIGEATLMPAALSVISDSFPPARRQLALGLYMSAIAVGSGLAYLVGGTILGWVARFPVLLLPLGGAVKPWQATFLAVGAPGVLLAALVLRIREPQRRELRSAAATRVPAKGVTDSLKQVLRFMFVRNRRTFLPVFLAFGGLALYAVSLQAWLPTYFLRKFGWTAARIGLIYGCILLLFATLGMIGGSWLATRLQKRGYKDALLRAPLWMTLVMSPAAIFATLVANPYITLLLVMPVTALAYGLFAVVPGILHAITPNEMRGQVSSVFSLFDNVLGMALGTSVVALLNDFVFRDPMAIGRSMSVVAALVLPTSALLLASSLKHFRGSVDAAAEWSTRPVPGQSANCLNGSAGGHSQHELR